MNLPCLTKFLTASIILASVTFPVFPETDSWPPGLVMQSMDDLGVGKEMDKFRLQMWGFIDMGFTGRLTGGQDPVTFLSREGRRPNSMHLQQLWWTLERTYDTEKKFDIGARFVGLFGNDAQSTHARGLLEHSGHRGSDAWFDILQTYIQFWYKTGEQSGLEILGGKFASPIGYEATGAAFNIFYTHGLLSHFTEPYTHTGVKITHYFNPQFSLFFAPVEGWDVFKDNNHAWTYLAGGTLTSKEKVGDNPRNSFTLIADTGPEEPNNTRDYRTLVEIIATQWLTPRLSHTVNADYGVEPGAVNDRTAQWGGIAYYLSYIVNEYATPACRIEWFRDPKGFLTNFPGSFFDLTFGATITPMPDNPLLENLVIRPELRWDFGTAEAYGGGRRYQLTANFDIIYKF